jgi:hypothetical protein
MARNRGNVCKRLLSSESMVFLKGVSAVSHKKNYSRPWAAIRRERVRHGDGYKAHLKAHWLLSTETTIRFSEWSVVSHVEFNSSEVLTG